MKLLSFTHHARTSFGALQGEQIMDLGARWGGDLATFLEAGEHPGFDADLSLADVTLLPPLTQRIFCVGINYDEHRLETGRDPVAHPTLFVRFGSSVVGHGAPLRHPRVSERYDYEGELAVIIGRRGRQVSESDAMNFVAGYACFNDGSVRDFQRHTSQFTPGKNFDHSGAFGPWVVTADELEDPHQLTLTTRVDGEVRQHANTRDLIFRIPSLIAYISSFTALQPGDVIATGTPAGVGDKRTPPAYLRPGSRVEVEIEGVGLLRNTVE